MNRSLKLLLLLTGFCLVAALFVYRHVGEQQSRMLDDIQEDAIWAAHQLDRESLRLKTVLALLEAQPEDAALLQDARLRFDILISRLSIIRDGELRTVFRDALNSERQLQEIDDTLAAMDAPLYADPDSEELARLAEQADAIYQESNRILLSLLSYNTRQKVDSRAELNSLFDYLGVLMLLLLASIALMMLILWRQYISVRRAHDESVRLAGQLEATAQEAQSANRAKSAFLATMSHELRTPMNGIIGMARMLMETPLDWEQRNCVETLNNSSASLLVILNDILDISKMESERFELEIEDFSLSRVLGNVIDLFRHNARENNVDLRFEMEAAARGIYRGDAGRLRQVLLNLIGNAIKFGCDGRVDVRVEKREDPAGTPGLYFEVEDRGCGISEEAAARLFQPFSQADSSTSRCFGGSGLGLAICKRIVGKMNGVVDFESRAGEGSTFWFWVPLAPERDEACELNQQACKSPVNERTEASAPTGRFSILLVDDNDTNLKVGLSMLKRLGLAADTSSNGEEALRKIADGHYDLVLMDVQMPVLDGLAATRRLRRSEGSSKDVPVVAMTASVMKGDREACEAAGMNDFLAKPVVFEELRGLLERWTARVLGETLPAEAGSEEAAEHRNRPRGLAVPEAVVSGRPGSGNATVEPAILLVEDNPTNLRVALKMIQHLGYGADTAEDGATALGKIEQRQFDLVLMDIQMPVMDGLEATRRIRSLVGDRAQVPVIALTANVMKGMREECLAAGMNDFLPKPLDLGELEKQIRYWLGTAPEPPEPSRTDRVPDG